MIYAYRRVCWYAQGSERRKGTKETTITFICSKESSTDVHTRYSNRARLGMGVFAALPELHYEEDAP